MTESTTAWDLSQLSEEELSSLMSNVWASLNPRPVELLGLVIQERVRRHALECQNLDCGFSPLY